MTDEAASHPIPLPAVRREGAAARAVDILALGAALLMPLLVVPSAYDPFRQPKLLLLHGTGIALIGVMAAMSIAGAVEWREVIRRRLPDLLVVAIAGWSIVSAVFAVHRRTALFAVLTALGAASLFLALRWRAKRYSIHALFLLIGAGAVNSIVAILQEYQIWNELVPVDRRHLHVATTGLLGNPNDVGSFLVPCLIAALAWLLAARSIAMRLLLGAFVLLIGSGILVSRTRGAMLGAAAGIAALVVVRWRRAAVERLISLTIIGVLALACYPPVLARVFAANVELFVSGRIVAFAAAWAMFTDSPVFGVGPGCFAYAYFGYATKVYPSMIEYAIAGKQYIFGEAHNDHLQILAETGIAGYVLLLAALVSLAAISWKRVERDTPERVRFARLAAAPLGASLFALALFQFPLYLAAPLTAFVFVAALAAGWSEDDEPLAG